MDMSRAAIYAGSFDPLTLGHTDLIERGAEIFAPLILAVGVASPKHTLFTTEERLAMARSVVQGMGLPHVDVTAFTGLLIDFARAKGVRILIRGLRAYSDFEYEFQMALTNRKMAPEIETLFMMPKEIHSYVSSSTVKEVARLGGDIGGFVPPEVKSALEERFRYADRSHSHPA